MEKMNPDTFDNNWVAGIKKKMEKELGQTEMFS